MAGTLPPSPTIPPMCDDLLGTASGLGSVDIQSLNRHLATNLYAEKPIDGEKHRYKMGTRFRFALAFCTNSGEYEGKIQSCRGAYRGRE